jgi:hypothetical protein
MSEWKIRNRKIKKEENRKGNARKQIMRVMKIDYHH